MVLLARCFAWREALTIVQPATLLPWHREAFRLLWLWRSRPGRPRLSADMQQLIAAELLLKIGLRVSPCIATWPAGSAGEDAARPGNAGPPSFETTPMPWSPATSASR